MFNNLITARIERWDSGNDDAFAGNDFVAQVSVPVELNVAPNLAVRYILGRFMQLEQLWDDVLSRVGQHKERIHRTVESAAIVTKNEKFKIYIF